MDDLQIFITRAVYPVVEISKTLLNVACVILIIVIIRMILTKWKK